VRNDDEISNQDNEEVTNLNKKRQINGNTLVERERPSQDRVKQKVIKNAEI
jgi:hypothetical protein